MSTIEIKNLSDIIKLNSNTVITNTKSAPLIPKGENFGSILVKLDITLKNKETSSEEQVNYVAKLIPREEYLLSRFDVQNTVNKEIKFYNEVVPSLQAFQQENGIQNVIDCFPKFFGGRLNLNGSREVDHNSAIILENLISAG